MSLWFPPRAELLTGWGRAVILPENVVKVFKMPKVIAIRREDKNKWEKRVAIVPESVKKLVGMGVEVRVQPSETRIYSDSQYQAAGAVITDQIYDSDLVVGVKEMPLATFKEGGAYMFFSHTIKGQSHNMSMLRRLIDLKCTLIDFECITDANNRRLVFFGRYAGLAGMVDTFHALGQRYLAEGKNNLFSEIKMAHEYSAIDNGNSALDNAKIAIEKLADHARANGFGAGDEPLVFGFAGYGNVSLGAQEIFDIFDHIEITPQELLELDLNTCDPKKLIKVVFKEEDTVAPKNEAVEFSKEDFFANPGNYRSIFAQYLPKMTGLLNCIFWHVQAPRLVTLDDCHRLFAPANTQNRLKVIGDLSCDIKGGIECTLRTTTPDAPSYVYDINKNDISIGYEGIGPVIMAVDNLPCELPRSASDEFSAALEPFLPELAKIDTRKSLESSALPAEIKRAIILWNGQLTSNFIFMRDYLSAFVDV